MSDAEDLYGKTTDTMVRLIGQAKDARAAGASRRSFFANTAALAGATALGAAGARLMQPIAAQAAEAAAATDNMDTTQEIIDIAATAESLATTFYYYALASTTLPAVNSAANRNYFQAAVVQEFAHLHELVKINATPLTTSFYFPKGMFTNQKVFFATASVLEDYFISAYIQAALDFSGAVSKNITTANPFAIGLAVQIGGVECEHRALLRVAAGENPANNRIIESALLRTVAHAAVPLAPFLKGGSGFVGPVKMPTPTEVNDIAKPYDFASFPPYHFV